jgi:dolichyl-phosphate-mannose-protein mannosyltransferase
VTATLEGTAQAAEPEAESDPEAPVEPPQEDRPVPAALVPWRDPHPWIGRLSLLLVTIAAGFTRFWALGFPPGRNSIPRHGFNFDEVYYATEAQEMLRYGYEDNRGYLFIVHPPLGKWLIAASERFVGMIDGGQYSSEAYLSNSMGWRLMPAFFGCLGVIMITRIVRRMMRSNLFGFIAGVLMVCEGMSLVLARTAILDIFLETFVIAGFGALVLDRDWMRARLARLIADGADLTGGIPSLGPRPWRLVAGVMLGLACAVKWSGSFFLVVFPILSLIWDRAALKSAGVRRPTLSWFGRSVLPSAGSFFVAPIGAYLLTYLGWFTGENAYDRHWAEAHKASTHLKVFGFKIPFSWGWVPDPIRSLGENTFEAFRFHEGLTSPHPYGSNPWSWLVLGRPVDFYYEAPSGCGAPDCSRQVLLIGTPILWWAMIPMLLWLAWHWFTTRDWRAASVWVAFLAGWVVWVYYWIVDDRTMFLFYMAPLMPFLIIGLTLALGVMLGPGGLRAHFPLPMGRPGSIRALANVRLALVPIYLLLMIALVHYQADDQTRRVELSVLGAAVIVSVGWDLFERWRATPAGEVRRFWGSLAVCGFLGLVVADFAWMWPIFTGGLLTYNEWHLHMWLPSWV